MTRASWLEALPALDPRAIAISRIGLGLLLLADVAERMTLVEVFYTDGSLVSRADAIELWKYRFPDAPRPWSLHLIAGSAAWQWTLLALLGACALSLVVGYRTRLASIGAFLLFLSTCQRAVLNWYGGDWALLAFLLWAMFLPLDRAFAVDPRAERDGSAVSSVGTAAFSLQLWMLLFFAGLQKILTSRTWRGGGAVDVVLHLENWTTSFGRWLGSLGRGVTHPLGYATLVAELGASWLLLLPVKDTFRGMAVAFVVAHFIGLGAALEVGLFPFVVVAAALAHLPPSWLDRLSSRTTPGKATRSFGSPAVVGLVVAGSVHALSLNIVGLFDEGAGPAWLKAPCGWLLPAQGWRMFRDVSPSWRASWAVVAATRRGDAEPTLRMPDAAPLSYDAASRIAALEGGAHWSTMGNHMDHIRARHPEILDRYLDRYCRAWPDLSLERVELIGVRRGERGLERHPIAEHRCSDTARGR